MNGKIVIVDCFKFVKMGTINFWFNSVNGKDVKEEGDDKEIGFSGFEITKKIRELFFCTIHSIVIQTCAF
jgi:hypothetical protein